MLKNKINISEISKDVFLTKQIEETKAVTNHFHRETFLNANVLKECFA